MTRVVDEPTNEGIEFIVPVTEPKVLDTPLEGEGDDSDDDEKDADEDPPKNEEDDIKNPNEDDKSNKTSVDEGSKVDIEGVTYTIDKDGNAVNDNNEIVYTADQLSFNESNADIDSLQSATGIEIAIDGVQPEFTLDYIIQREKAVVDFVTEKAKKEGLAEYLSANPDIESIVKHKERYGDLSSYGVKVDYDTVNFEQLTEVQKLELISTVEESKGSTKERAVRIANMSKQDNTLDEDAKAALEALKQSQYQEIESIKQSRENAAKDYMNGYYDSYGVEYDINGVPTSRNIKDSVYDKIINQHKLLDMSIPSTGVTIVTSEGKKNLTIPQLAEYITKPVQASDSEVFSQAEVDLIEKLADKEFRAAMALIAMRGINSLVEAGTQRKIVARVQRAVQNRNATVNGKPVTTTGEKPKVDFTNIG